MKQKYQDLISDILGCEPISVNSKIVSAQDRERLYWTNLPFSNPKRKPLTVFDILENSVDSKYFANEQVTNRTLRIIKDIDEAFLLKHPKFAIKGDLMDRENPTRQYGLSMNKTSTLRIGTIHGIYDNGKVRKLTPVEYERLQTVSDNYTNFVSDTQRYKMLSNGWTVSSYQLAKLCHNSIKTPK